MSDRDFPQWATEYLNEWQRLLYLHEWSLRVRLSPHPAEDGQNPPYGAVDIRPGIRVAKIEFRDDIPDEPTAEELAEWQKTIIHELLHVRLGCLTTLIEDCILPELSPSAKTIAENVIRGELEPAVELLSQTLHTICQVRKELGHS